MKRFLRLTLFYTLFIPLEGRSQQLDTLLNVGNHKIHFHILKGKGTPILFEAGAGNDGTIWDTILTPIAKITGTTLITYDRAGFGTSTIDILDTVVSNHGVLSSIKDLEAGLKVLGYNKEIMLVAHSYGGYLATLYSVSHPNLVKSIVLIDVAHNFYLNNDFLEKEAKEEGENLPELKKSNPGFFYLASTIQETVKVSCKRSIPAEIPVIDFMAGIPVKEKPDQIAYWKECHQKFVESHPKCAGITAYACHHYIWQDNPTLIINAICKAYAESLKGNEKAEVYQRALNFALVSSNDMKKEGFAMLHSEENLCEWGIYLFQHGEQEKAFEILKLNVRLFPTRWEAYQIYAEALQKMDRKEEAISMYRKSLELNPGNDDGKKSLEELLK